MYFLWSADSKVEYALMRVLGVLERGHLKLGWEERKAFLEAQQKALLAAIPCRKRFAAWAGSENSNEPGWRVQMKKPQLRDSRVLLDLE